MLSFVKNWADESECRRRRAEEKVEEKEEDEGNEKDLVSQEG